jgi:spore germination protein GerM
MALHSRTGRHLLLVAPVVLVALMTSCGRGNDAASTTDSATNTADATATSASGSADPATAVATRAVEVYFNTGDGTDCGQVSSFDRAGDATVDPAESAFRELVAGPTAEEEAAGASSFFSSATADAVLSTCLDAGVLTVDLADLSAEIPEAGTSCGSEAFLSSLNATAFQFVAVDRVRYLFGGSCNVFGEFTQTGACEFDRTS